MRPDKMKTAKIKAGNYCAYQERTQQEVRDKLYSIGLYSDEVEQVLTELIIEDFVNEERFAKTYARGKFNLKHWGKVKIAHELKRKKISPFCIRKALEEIEDDDYNRVLKKLMNQRLSGYQGDDYVIKNKTARFLINRGFEAEIVWEQLNIHFSSNE
jgi:regulatory protein